MNAWAAFALLFQLTIWGCTIGLVGYIGWSLYRAIRPRGMATWRQK